MNKRVSLGQWIEKIYNYLLRKIGIENWTSFNEIFDSFFRTCSHSIYWSIKQQFKILFVTNGQFPNSIFVESLTSFT